MRRFRKPPVQIHSPLLGKQDNCIEDGCQWLLNSVGTRHGLFKLSRKANCCGSLHFLAMSDKWTTPLRLSSQLGKTSYGKERQEKAFSG